MTAAVDVTGAGRRYGHFWALRDCTLTLPAGSITAVVGPNGAGKSTLLNMLVGLLRPSAGQLLVDGDEPTGTAAFLSRVGYLAQDSPLYRDYRVEDMLRFGRAMNPAWDDALARERLAAAEVPLRRRAGKLSGGQRAQVALALALAKRPRVLILDEPLAALDPLARRDFLRSLLDSAAATHLTVLLSSHLIGELARVCDHLVVIRNGRLRLAGELDELLAEHHWVAGSHDDTAHLPNAVQVLSRSSHERHARLLVRSADPLYNPALVVTPVDVEDLVMAYLEAAPDARPRRAAMIWQTWRQQRSAAIVAAVILAGLAGAIVTVGTIARRRASALGLPHCLAAHRDCGSAIEALHRDFHSIPPVTGALVAIPLLAGMFWAAPLVSREYEAGTHRLAWTQSISPLRWITTKIVLIFGVLAIVIAALAARRRGHSIRSMSPSAAASTAPGTT